MSEKPMSSERMTRMFGRWASSAGVTRRVKNTVTVRMMVPGPSRTPVRLGLLGDRDHLFLGVLREDQAAELDALGDVRVGVELQPDRAGAAVFGHGVGPVGGELAIDGVADAGILGEDFDAVPVVRAAS